MLTHVHHVNVSTPQEKIISKIYIHLKRSSRLKFELSYLQLCNPWGALVFEVGYHPHKKIHAMRVVFQDQTDVRPYII